LKELNLLLMLLGLAQVAILWYISIAGIMKNMIPLKLMNPDNSAL
jgi:hypothetical protein